MSKKNQQRLIESLQASLEAETRSKAEILRTKKKLESDIQELEGALDHTSRVSNVINQNFQPRAIKIVVVIVFYGRALIYSATQILGRF